MKREGQNTVNNWKGERVTLHFTKTDQQLLDDLRLCAEANGLSLSSYCRMVLKKERDKVLTPGSVIEQAS